MLAQPKRSHLNRALSKLGICSRTVADGWIAQGRVRVNGERAKDPEQWVELGADRIEIEGLAGTPDTAPDQPAGASYRSDTEVTPVARAHVYLRLHKPPGYVTTRSDELGRRTVYDLLPAASGTKGEAAWIFPVGRLDRESEGLLLMTDDGEWANLLTDPTFHVEKEYRVKLDRQPLPGELDAFRAGVMLGDRRTLPARVDAEGAGWHRVVITEGRNRQIRRMFHALGYKVKRLVRVSIGPLKLGDLEAGEARDLEPEEVEALRLAAKSVKAPPTAP